MVKDLRFSRRPLGDIENARLAKALAAIQIAALRPSSFKNRKGCRELDDLLHFAVKQLSGVTVPCQLSDLEDITGAAIVPLDAHEKSQDSSRLIIEVFSLEAMTYLQKHPERVRSLSGHVFEDLMAEIITWLGFEEISLRVKTKLGEVDLFGFSRDLLGARIAYIFELKQLGNSMRPVELREVTRLYGIREGLRQRLGVTQGVFVTTTDYTQPAKEAGEIHHLALKNYGNLIEWLKEYEQSPNGLHLKGDI